MMKSLRLLGLLTSIVTILLSFSTVNALASALLDTDLDSGSGVGSAHNPPDISVNGCLRTWTPRLKVAEACLYDTGNTRGILDITVAKHAFQELCCHNNTQILGKS